MKHLLFVFLIGVASAQQCRNSADRAINGRCFTLVNQQLSWQDARDWCHHRSPVSPSYLATVTDTTTANFLASYARSSFNTNEGFFWIGLFRNNASSRWQWDDGTPVTWTNFALQNSYTFVAESITNARFTAFTIDAKFNFICSYNPNAVSTGGTTEVPFSETPSTIATTADYTSPPASTCTRHTNSTFLFAYSTDSLQYDLNSVRSEIVFLASPPSFFGYTTFANVRIDLKEEEEIQYHSDVFGFNASVTARPTNSSLGFGDRTTGSDVFRMIQKYLNNTQSTICGSIIYVLVKRYPNEVDVTDLITQLRENHVFVYFIIHTSPSGGLQTKSLFEMSSRTNGFSVFMGTTNYWLVGDDGIAVLYRPYQFLAQNYVVSGQGRIEIPSFRTPATKPYMEQMLVVVTVQDHAIDSNFRSLNYTISSHESNWNFTGPDSESGWPRFGSGIIAQPQLTGLVDYKMTIDYHYANSTPQVIEVRMNSNWYHDFIPFASN